MPLSLLKHYAKRIKTIAKYKYGQKSFAQEGEDLVLQRLMTMKKNGFYIDIGAHHPFRFSNTALFYQKGWHGINIDPMPNSMALFRRFRQRDINLEIAIGNRKSNLTYYIFNDPALNTFDANLAKQYAEIPEYHVNKEVSIPLLPLRDILTQHLLPNQNIDFMSVDVEGLDLEVLKTNDWQKYRPNYILCEIYEPKAENITNTEIYKFLLTQQYHWVAKTLNTCVFRKNNID